MKRIFLVSSLILMFFMQSWAAIVPVTDAQQVAQNFYNSKVYQGGSLKLAYTATDNAANPVYYVFNAGVSNGFVIVSAESMVKPILGYSLAGSFVVNNMATSTSWWLGKYKGQILGARATVTEASAAVSAKWAQYYNNNLPAAGSRAVSGVSPLCYTTWNQNPYYNDSCPYDKQQNALTVTGCVATAMAQIMKYWSYPPQGTGTATDNNYQLSSLTVDLSSITYDWSAMPPSISSNNAPIAQLMYDCGVAVGMSYGVNGSGAQDVGNSPSAQNAYSQYFGYDPNLQGQYREEYADDADWITLIETELDTGRLVQYGGFESGRGAEGHSWVCDGYDKDTLFHMNWGWGGANDGYYSINNLDPSGLGPDPDNPDSMENLNAYEDAITGIKPLNWGTSLVPANLSLSNYITFSQTPYVMNTPLTVTVPISNNDNSAFTGSFSADVYDQNGVYQTNIQQFQNVSISGGKDTILSFNTHGIFFFPGNFTIGISYQTKGIARALVPAGGYVNPAPIQFTGSGNTLLLDSSINITTGVIAASTPFTVTANIYNSNSLVFSGTIGAALFDMDYNFVGLVDSTSNTDLFAGKKFTYTFNSTGIDIAPGQYYLAIYSENTNANDVWALISDSSFPNPILVQVGAPLTPDIYEINNVYSGAYAFVPYFDGGANAEVTTTGSNMHVGTDVDYYTIAVPTGGFYTVNAQVYDSQNPNGSDTYTNDVVFSFTADDSVTWSSTYDGAMPAPYQYNGGNITFLVTDKVAGTIGTYLLKVDITNDVAAGIATPGSSTSMTVYPNPAHDAVVINAGNLGGKFELAIYDLVGKKLLSRDVEIQQGQPINEDLSVLDNGMYIVRLLSDSATREAKVIVDH